MPLFVRRSQWFLPVHFRSNLVDAFQGQEEWISHLKFVFQLHGCFVHAQHHSLKATEYCYQRKLKSRIRVDQGGLVSGASSSLHFPSHHLPGFLYAIASRLFRSGQKVDNVCHRFVWNACRQKHSTISCCFEWFGGDVSKSQFVCCFTSCGDHLVEHVCRHLVLVKFERTEIRLLQTFPVGSRKLLSTIWVSDQRILGWLSLPSHLWIWVWSSCFCHNEEDCRLDSSKSRSGFVAWGRLLFSHRNSVLWSHKKARECRNTIVSSRMSSLPVKKKVLLIDWGYFAHPSVSFRTFYRCI